MKTRPDTDEPLDVGTADPFGPSGEKWGVGMGWDPEEDREGVVDIDVVHTSDRKGIRKDRTRWTSN